MTITADTVFYAFMILFFLIITHSIAYLEGWQRGSREGLKKDLRAFISREEIDKAVDEIIKEREEWNTK